MRPVPTTPQTPHRLLFLPLCAQADQVPAAATAALQTCRNLNSQALPHVAHHAVLLDDIQRQLLLGDEHLQEQSKAKLVLLIDWPLIPACFGDEHLQPEGRGAPMSVCCSGRVAGAVCIECRMSVYVDGTPWG